MFRREEFKSYVSTETCENNNNSGQTLHRRHSLAGIEHTKGKNEALFEPQLLHLDPGLYTYM